MKKLIVFLILLIAVIFLVKYQPVKNKPSDEQIRSDVRFDRKYEQLLDVKVKGVRIKDNLAQAFVEVKTGLIKSIGLFGVMSKEENPRVWRLAKKYFYFLDSRSHSRPVSVEADNKSNVNDAVKVETNEDFVFYYVKTDRGWAKIRTMGINNFLQKTFGTQAILNEKEVK
ncbi:MAG: hypothetical protein U9R38_04465 [Candidatus Margulisiibacteriota bacterium]|nr:hypothetical protein [Candidatus Margulisiibacteriota bacterium]